MTRALGRRVAVALGALRRVFANPDLRRIQLAWLGANTGHFCYFLAISVFAYDAGGAAAVGIAAVARFVPAAVVTPFAAVLADRHSRQRVMVVSDLARAAALAAAAVAILGDAPAALAIGLAAVAAVVSTPFEPAKSALLSTLARTPEELTAANLASSTIQSVTMFAGPALGGILLAASGPALALLASVATLLWSAWLVSRIRGERPARTGDGGERESFWREALAGFRTIAADADLRIVVGLTAAQTLVFGAFTVFTVVLALELLHTGDAGVGYLNSAVGVGALLGAVASLGLVGGRRLGRGLGVGIALWGAPVALAGIFVNEPAALLLMAVVGLANTLVDVPALTLLQRIAPEAVLGRVFGVLETLIFATIALGSLAAPALIAAVGNRTALVLTGTLLPVLALLSWPKLRALDAAVPPPTRELRLLEALPLFVPLNPATLEELAGRLVPLRFRAGETIVRQGDPGDRFYVVGDGSVDVAVDGRAVATQRAGSHFGEIALIRNVPRTATVTAHDDVQLYALERDDFLDAVTGHPRSSAAAEVVIGTRLARARPTPAAA